MANECVWSWCPNTQTPPTEGAATPPGDTLRETLKAKGISQTLLAETMGRPTKTINEIIHAKVRITQRTAIELEHALNIPAHVWLALETNYRLALSTLDR
jgi:addiction module HigA family antidote